MILLDIVKLMSSAEMGLVNAHWLHTAIPFIVRNLF